MCYFFLFFKRNIVFKKIKQNICEWRPMGHKQSREVGEVLRDRQTHCWCCVVFFVENKKNRILPVDKLYSPTDRPLNACFFILLIMPFPAHSILCSA